MPAAAGPMAQLVNQKGEPLHLVDPDADSADHLPVFEPLYSRSSVMTFVLSEVLLQALTLMNSPQQRGRRAHAETPRRLRRIVLTLPTGMPLAERPMPAASSRSPASRAAGRPTRRSASPASMSAAARPISSSTPIAWKAPGPR
jgi:hypothetical protein